MTGTSLRCGDWVLVRRPRLPSRIGRVVRLGKRHVYVGLGRYGPRHQTKKYSRSSVELLLRTGVKTS